MRQVEDQIKEIYENNEAGVFMQVAELGILKEMEGKKDLFLLQEEQKCRLKRRALWLEEGD